MGVKQVASAAALAAMWVAAPVLAQEVRAPMTTFFVSIPLDAKTKKEQMPNFGLQFQGSKPYQTVRVDYDSFKFLPGALAALEVKYVVAGVVAVGTAVAVARKDHKQSDSFAQQRQQQLENCPVKCQP